MKLPNLLGSRRGRLAAFFFLYLTEGIPLGFVAVAVAAQLRRQGVGPAEIGAFVGAFERFGYPGTLLVDAAAGLVCLALLPLMGRPRETPGV